MSYRTKYDAARKLLILTFGITRSDASHKTIVEFVDGLISEEVKRMRAAKKAEFWKKVRFLFGLEG